MWTETQRLVSPSAQDLGYLGDSLLFAGDTLLGGSRYEPFDVGLSRGSVTLFQRAQSNWEGTAQFRPDTAYGTVVYYGMAIAWSGRELLIGIPADTHGEEVTAGSIEVRPLAPFVLSQVGCDQLAPCGNVTYYGSCSARRTASTTSDDLVLRAEQLPAGQTGLFAMAPMTTAGTLFGDGVLALGGGFFRYPVRQVSGEGAVEEGPGIVALSAGFGSGQILAGSTWNYQFWYRDPSGPCGGGFNMSNAVSVVFEP